MTIHAKALAALLCGGALALGPASAQDQYTLQYKLSKQHVYRYADSTMVKSSQEVMGQENKATVTVFSTLRFVPSGINDDGSTVLTVSPDAMTVKIASARMDTTLSPAELIGKRTRLTISKLGAPLRREIVDTVQMTGLAASVGRQGMLRLHVLPEKPVRIGDTWNATVPDTVEAVGGKVVTTSSAAYTLLSRESRNGHDCLKVSYKGTMTMAGKGSMGGAEYFLEGNGTTEGTLFMDPATGLALQDDMHSEVESTVALTGAQNMTIPSTQSMTLHRVLLQD